MNAGSGSAVPNASGVAVTDEDGDAGDGHFRGTIPADGTYYAKVEASAWAHNGHKYLLTDSPMTRTATTSATS